MEAYNQQRQRRSSAKNTRPAAAGAPTATWRGGTAPRAPSGTATATRGARCAARSGARPGRRCGTSWRAQTVQAAVVQLLTLRMAGALLPVLPAAAPILPRIISEASARL